MYHSRSGSVLTSEKVLTLAEQEFVIARCVQTIRGCERRGEVRNRVRDVDDSRTRDPYKREFRDPLMVLIAVETGARAKELGDLLAGDFRLERGTLFIRTRKRGRPRELPLREETSAYLKTWILRRAGVKNWDEVPATLRIFPIEYDMYRTAWLRFRPNSRRKGHSTRHGFALRLYTRSKNLRLLQLALGHRSLANTEVYMDFHYSQEELRRHMHE